MVDPALEVPLPPSVEHLLRNICAAQSQPPPDTNARRELALLGEESSLRILKQISGSSIRESLNKFIMYMVRKSRPVPTQECVSPHHSRSSVTSSPVKSIPCSSSRVKSVIYSSPVKLFASPPAKLRIIEIGSGSSGDNLGMSSTNTVSQQLRLLGELEFRRAFLLLSYIGRKKLDDVISADEIRRLKHIPMRKFELEAWNILSQRCAGEEVDRREHLDWDSGKTYVYHCHVYINGTYKFKGPYLSPTRTHLQRVLGDENVLLVKFAADEKDEKTIATGHSDYFAIYGNIAKYGILVGQRRFHFFVFKDGGKEEKKKNPTTSPVKCYFVCLESNAFFDETGQYLLPNRTVHEARCLFMHAHTVPTLAKYMARFSLILSKTITLDVDLSSVDVQRIEDVPCLDEDGCLVYDIDGKLQIHTDGTGFISEDLAVKCPRSFYKGEYLKNGNLEKVSDPMKLDGMLAEAGKPESQTSGPPLLIQFRLFNKGCAVKGIFLMNKKLPPRTMQVRPSMIKVVTDPLRKNRTVDSLEIVGISNQPKKTYLSRYLIALLNYGGVPNEYFMGLLMNALEDARTALYKKRAALRVSLNYGEMDDFSVARMILSGIPLDEGHLQHRLSTLLKEARNGLKGGRLPIEGCYYLMGTVDPTGLLNRDEVCIILENGQISGKVLVYKHPGLHFGDIHILNATYMKELEDVVGHGKYAIFFPMKGPRSLADEMANSDFDGDMYWVSRNPQLLEYFKQSDPWIRTCSTQKVSDNRRPAELSPEDLEHELFQLFLTTRFQPSTNIGVAADCWLAYFDRLLTLGDNCVNEKVCLKAKMLQLVDIYYDSLDAPKTGIKVEVPKELKADRYPHYMGRNDSYNSTSILGQIYDKVESSPMEPMFMEEIKKLPCFEVQISELIMNFWKVHYQQYRHEMSNAIDSQKKSQDNSPDEVIRKYKQILYDAPEFEDSPKKLEVIFDEALAIYNIAYDTANTLKSVTYCGFPWRVAGPALCKYYVLKKNEKSLICLPSVLNEIFG